MLPWLALFHSSSILLYLCLENNSWLRCLLNKSAVLSFDLIKIVFTTCSSAYSPMKWCLTEMCLVHWLQTELLARNIAPTLSTLTTIVCSIDTLRNSNICFLKKVLNIAQTWHDIYSQSFIELLLSDSLIYNSLGHHKNR